MTRILWALFFSAMLGYSFSKTMEYERDANRTGFVVEKHPGRLTMVYQSPMLLPYLLATIFVTFLLAIGIHEAWDYFLHLVVELLLVLTAYYLALLAVLPLLRRWFSARFCATMWLLPVFLYWLPHMWRTDMIEPWLVIRIPPMVYQILGIIWLIGFVVILCWKVISHLRFRKEVLKNSYPVTHPDILELWKREQELIERKKPIPLVYSPYVTTPMTVGKWNRTIRTLLPERSYTQQELRLIFRHELRHVQRLDVDTKVFYGFCEAFCWFNPLVWLAMRKASADLELSCDEMVVYGMEESDRRRYAELLLDTAGDDRGFSTCLSASAKTLRYRLKSVMEQRKRLTGTLFLTVTMAVLILCSGAVVATSVYGTLDEVLFSNYNDLNIGQILIKQKKTRYSSGFEEIYAWDQAALLNYLQTVPVTKVAGQGVELELDDEKYLVLWVSTGEGSVYVECSADWLTISRGTQAGIYHIDTSLNWDKINECLDFTAPDPDPSPVRPRLDYYISLWESSDEPFVAMDRLLKRTNDNGVRTPDTPLTDWTEAGGLSTFPLPEGAAVRFAFNYDPVWYTVDVIGQNGEESYTVKGTSLPDNTMQLAPYSANYRIKGHFRSHRNTTYDMEFYFRIEFPEQE